MILDVMGTWSLFIFGLMLGGSGGMALMCVLFMSSGSDREEDGYRELARVQRSSERDRDLKREEV